MGKVQAPTVASSLTEEEIRAYRHHRKRLARIVADQWLYAARFRLITLRFRKQRGEKLKRFCIIEWRDAVERKMRMSQILERAGVLCRFILERRIFHTWWIAVETQQLIRNAFDRTVQITQRSRGRRALTALHAYSLEGKYKREQQLRMEVFYTHQLLRTFLTKLYYFLHQRRLWRKQEERADQKWTEHLLKLTLRGWKQLLIEREPASIATPEDPVIQARIVTKLFWRWHVFVYQKRAKINNTRDKKLLLAQRHHERNLLRAVYDGWDRARFSSRLAREVAQHSLEASAMEVAVSWFVKSLVKRILFCWRHQTILQKNHRRNNWHAVVHFKMQSIAKGIQGFRANVELEHFKHCLQMLSVESYQKRLKRKAVTGCKLLHQSKRLKSAQLEHATAQWKTAKLQERFDKWYFATARSSIKKNKLLESIRFSCRQLYLRGFQTWRAVTGLKKDKKNLAQTRLNSLRESLDRLKKLHVLGAWKSLRKEMNLKRFNEARVLQFLFGSKATAVVKALYVHMQRQKLKRSLLAKATQLQKTKSFHRALSTWKNCVFLRQLGRLAADHRRCRLLKHALHTLAKWKDQQEEMEKPQQETTSREDLKIHRKLRNTQTQQLTAQLDFPPIRLASTPRAQPRRPAFLYNEADQTKETITGLKVGDQLMKPGNEGLCNKMKEKALRFVAREVEWMEQILIEYEELKVQIVKLRAELALLLEARSLGVSDDVHQGDHMQMLQDQKTLLFQQELHSLEAKKVVQMPLIQAVLSRVQDLRTNGPPTL